MKKILTVVGARPQFIKASVTSRSILTAADMEEVIVHTGQHYDTNMSDVFFEEMGIPAPKYHLDVSRGTHGQMTGRMLERLEATFVEEKPDVVLVYGDTNSTLAGALAASKLHISVAHVEAGLRSFNRKMPEEINRVITDHVSEMLLTPTQSATKNLKSEGIFGEHVVQVGDVMYDAALYFGGLADKASNATITAGVEPKKFVLSTIHRQENTDDPDRLRAIFESLGIIAKEIPVILPLHPRTKSCLERAGLMSLTEGLNIAQPMGYLDMVALEKSAAVVVTDSGGVQKEAFFHRVPCVTLRDETEWVELVEAGWNSLVPPLSSDAIVSGIRDAITSKGRNVTPYGTGNAADLITEALARM